MKVFLNKTLNKYLLCASLDNYVSVLVTDYAELNDCNSL